VEVDQKLRRHELGGVHDVQQLAQRPRVGREVGGEELARHRAPHLGALHVGDVPGAREVEPVGLVQLGAFFYV
jgi:hypothetical protein